MPHTKVKPPCTKVRVSFSMDEATWDVVHSGSELFEVTKETAHEFVVEYDDASQFGDALSRFGGLVPYTELGVPVA